MRYQIVIMFTILLFSCSKTREREKHIIPNELVGSQIIINFNQSDGQPKKYEGNQRIYEIPRSGTLNTKFKTNFGWYNENSLEFYLLDGDSLESLPWNYNRDTTDFFTNHQGSIGVMGFFYGQTTFSYVVDTVDYNLFKKKKLDYREDIFGKSKDYDNR